MVLFYWGADGFRSHEHSVRTVESFKEKRDPQGYNVFVFDIRDAQSSAIWEAISSVPFMAEKKMIEIMSGDFKKIIYDIQDFDIQNWIEKEELLLKMWACIVNKNTLILKKLKEVKPNSSHD